MPNYTATKQHFRNAIASAVPPPSYLVPSQRYHYVHPDGTGYPDSPFESIWFLQLGEAHGGSITAAWASELRHTRARSAAPASPPLLLFSLEDLAAHGKVSTAQRPSSKRRRRMFKRAASAAVVTDGFPVGVIPPRDSKVSKGPSDTNTSVIPRNGPTPSLRPSMPHAARAASASYKVPRPQHDRLSGGPASTAEDAVERTASAHPHHSGNASARHAAPSLTELRGFAAPRPKTSRPDIPTASGSGSQAASGKVRAGAPAAGKSSHRGHRQGGTASGTGSVVLSRAAGSVTGGGATRAQTTSSSASVSDSHAVDLSWVQW